MPPQEIKAEIQRVVLLLWRAVECGREAPLGQFALAQRVLDLAAQVIACQLLRFWNRVQAIERPLRLRVPAQSKLRQREIVVGFENTRIVLSAPAKNFGRGHIVFALGELGASLE